MKKKKQTESCVETLPRSSATSLAQDNFTTNNTNKKLIEDLKIKHILLSIVYSFNIFALFTDNFA